ncbi:MAG: efflux RND transporter permease subunit [Bacteroidales bacterium]
MLLPRVAIKNYQFTIVAFILLVVFGISAYRQMPQTENPAIYVPGASVVVVYPGASPEDLEQLVALPVEEALNELDDIEKIETTLKEGLASINIEFSFSTDAGEKYNEVVQKTNAVRADLPEDIFMLKTSRWTSTDVAILQLAMVSEQMPYPVMENEADKLKKIIERTEGIKKVSLAANPRQQVNVELDMQQMKELEISIKQVEQALESYNANIPGGSLEIGAKSFSVKTSGSFNKLEEIENTIVKSQQGQIIHLKDIAQVGFSLEEIKYKARFNGSRAIFVVVEQKEDYNIFDIKESLDPKISSFADQLPGDMQLHKVFEQADKVDDKIDQFTTNLLLGILLVGLVIFSALGARPSLVVIIAIPLTVLISLGFVDLAGFGIQQITIAALIVALGLLVDNGIVIVENISRFIREGYSPREASVKATSQIGWAVMASTLTTVLAFVPVILMPDKAGDYIKSLPVTVIATLTVSLLIALTLSPLIASGFFKSKRKLPAQGRKKTGPIKDLLRKFIEGPYRKALAFALQKPALVIVSACLILVVSIFAFTRMELSFFPPAETNEFMVRVHLPEGSNLQETEAAVDFAETVLDSTQSHFANRLLLSAYCS